jgi:hypothetical protein
MGCQSKCLDDQPLGRFLSLLCFPDLFLARDSFSICSDWYVFWSHSWLARFGDDPMGKPTGRTFLHSEPMARASRHAGNRSTSCLRLVARHALREQRCRRATLADDRLRNGAFPGGGRRANSLLSRLLHWSASANRASRATARQLKRITDLALVASISSRLSFVCVAVSETLKQLPYEQQKLSAPVRKRTHRAGDVAGVPYAAVSRANRP